MKILTIRTKLVALISLLIFVSTVCLTIGASFLNFTQTRNQNTERLTAAVESFRRDLNRMLRNDRRVFSDFVRKREIAKQFKGMALIEYSTEDIPILIGELATALKATNLAFYHRVGAANHLSLSHYYSADFGGTVLIEKKNGQTSHTVYVKDNNGFVVTMPIREPAQLFPEVFAPLEQFLYLKVRDGRLFLVGGLAYISNFSDDAYHLRLREQLGQFVLEKELEMNQEKRLDINLVELDKDLGVSFNLYDTYGAMGLGQTPMPDLDMENLPLSDSEVVVLQDKEGNSYDSLLIKLEYNYETIGYLSANISQDATVKMVIDTVGLLFTVALGVLVCSILASLILVTQFTRPILLLSRSAAEIAAGKLDQQIDTGSTDELGVLARSFVHMRNAIRDKLADLNAEIARRRGAESELANHRDHLQELVDEQTVDLSAANKALQKSLTRLQLTHAQLVESEKMAALGSLVAGVAHEINTPIGIGVTAASHLDQETRECAGLFTEGKLKSSGLKKYFQIAGDASGMILSNLQRAANLIRSFKQVAVDQSSQERRIFHMRTYIDEVLLSLKPQLKNTNHTVTLECPDDLSLDSYPGAFSQIITNLVMNSLVHGFEETESGEIKLEFCPDADEDMLHFRYSDNGKGIAPANVTRIFDPFFTTRRGLGGSGLGLHIVYNLVTQKLRGSIRCSGAPGEGAVFEIACPLHIREEKTDPADKRF